MTRTLVAGFVLVALTFAGCMEGNDMANGDNGAGVSNGPQPWALNLNAEACNGLTVAILVEPEQAYAYLPPGYTPRDAQGLFETSVATGKIPVFVAALACENPSNNDLNPSSYSTAFSAVFVEAPDVPGFRTSAEYEFYLTHFYTNHGGLADAMMQEMWDVSEATISTAVTSYPSGSANASAVVSDQDGEIISMSPIGPTPIPSEAPVGYNDWSLRLWHQTAKGLGYFDYGFTSDVPVGTGACSFREGSPAALTTGYTRCPPYPIFIGERPDPENPEVPEWQPNVPEGSDSTIAALFPDLDLVGSLQWLPGVAAG